MKVTFSLNLRPWAVVLACCLSVIVARLCGVFEPMERGGRDRLLQSFLSRDEVDAITVVGITQECLDELGAWPWTRKRTADLLDRLHDAGAKAVAMDILFAEPGDDPEADDALALAIGRTGCVLLPAFSPEQLPAQPGSRGLKALRMTRCHQRFVNRAGEGHINVRPDADGVLRRVPGVLAHAGRTYASLGVAAAAQYLDVPPGLVEQRGNRLVLGQERIIPVDDQGCVHIKWPDRPVSVYRFSDVIAGRVDKSVFRDRLVFVGHMAHGIVNQEILRTPQGRAHGVLVHAAVAATTVSGSFVDPAGVPVVLATLAGLSALFCWWVPRLSMRHAIALAAGTVGLHAAAAVVLFHATGIVLEIIAPSVLCLGVVGARMWLGWHEAAHEALTDSLTGLANRRGALEVVDRTLARRAGHGAHSVVLVDIDGFASFNNMYGHPAGDAILVRVSQVLQDAFPSGLVSRLGGDEFLIFLPGASATEAAAMAEGARSRLRAQSGPCEITLSLGVSAAPQDGTTRRELVRAADEALYQAKRSGRDRTCVRDRDGSGIKEALSPQPSAVA